ncbi:MAG: protein kinase [Solirubrobacteraceae bacterium]
MPYAPDLSGCALEDRYELLAVIGEGAFGRVYRARDRRLERIVAVKLIKPWWAEDPAWARSFEREAQLLARVSDPGIVQIFDVGQAEEGLYYVSELVPGESLAARLARGPFAPWAAAEVAEQLCRALGRAHAAQIVHRDVKPANILLGPDGQVKVGDFGVARLAEGSSDGAGATVVGTPRYMAPEQARGHATTPATDVYSAGIVLYEMIAGQPPFTERAPVELALRHLRDRPPALAVGTPAVLAEVVCRALAKSPGRRFADGGEMARALAAARAGAPQPAAVSRRTAPPGAVRPSHRRRSGPDAVAASQTRRAPQRGPRRTHNPAGRRRRIAALTAVFVLLAAMLTAGLVLSGGQRVRVPSLIGLRRAGIEHRARALPVRVSYTTRWSARPRGTAIAQAPRVGRGIDQGASLRVVLSAGPPPVRVPQLAGLLVSDAQAALARVGLRSLIRAIAAPGEPAGAVTSQSPAPGVWAARSHAVLVDVVKTLHWQAVATVHSSGAPTTASFRIRGPHWRVVYTMSYQGTCTFIIFCSGPSATVDGPTGARSFDLSDGGRQTESFAPGSGRFTLSVHPGSDSARWTAWIQDWY